MSSKIDERVVELKFNTKQFEQGVKSTSDNLDKLNKSLQMDGAKKGITELQGAVGKFSLKNISDGVSEVASKFGALSIIGAKSNPLPASPCIRRGRRPAAYRSKPKPPPTEDSPLLKLAPSENDPRSPVRLP